MSIVIDWSRIQNEAEFYTQLLPQLEAPQWHGRNLDALSDSIGVGSINGVEPPYSIAIFGTAHVPSHLVAFSQGVESVLRNAVVARSGITLSFSPASGGSAR